MSQPWKPRDLTFVTPPFVIRHLFLLRVQTPDHHVPFPSPIVMPMTIKPTPTLPISTSLKCCVHHTLQLLEEDKVVRPLAPPTNTGLSISVSVESACLLAEDPGRTGR